MDKALCFGALGVGALMMLVFLLDLIIGQPFAGGGKDNPYMIADVIGLLASGVVAYLGYNASRDVK
ncbi:MAG: hypothetical protein ACKODX_03745 [Gemmata sp.]